MDIAGKELERLGKALVRNMAEDLVRYNVIDPKGKSDEEVRLEIFNYLSRLAENKENNVFAWAIDHTSTLLKEGRRFARLEKYELSCLFYATWFEHWLNDLINTTGRRKKFSEQDITQIIRDIQFRAKSTWLLRVLDLKPIAETHLKRMQSIIDSRNAFVHYKWKHVDIDDERWGKDEEALAEIINSVEKTVSYLRRLQNKQFFSGRKGKILP